jgi:tetratricopeptide (TPR) repeat protein
LTTAKPLSYLNQELGEHEAAIEARARAPAARRGGAGAGTGGRRGGALRRAGRQVFERGVAGLPSGAAGAGKRATMHFHIGNTRGALGQADAALAAYTAATRENPRHAAAWTNMGTIYQGRKQVRAPGPPPWSLFAAAVAAPDT